VRVAGGDVRFPALRHRNFRLYAVGQLASIGGTWMQNVAMSWLVLELTRSGKAVGLVSAALFIPSLALGAWAGTVADRFDARRAVLWLQILLGLQAAVLAVVVFAKAETLWLLVLLALWNGVGGAFDRPVRQTLINELVGDAELPNAIATNSALVQLGLIAGPAVGAVLIDQAGIGWCFAVNAASYVVLYVAIAVIRPADMVPRPRPAEGDQSVAAGLRHLRTRPDLRLLLVTLGLASLLAFRVDVLVPILAKDLGGSAGLLAALTVVRGVGALGASLFLASRFGAPSFTLLRNALVVLGAALVLMSIPNRAVALVASLPVGAAFMAAVVCLLSLTQLLAEVDYRGRIVAVWFVVLSAGVVAGSLLAGALADWIGSRATIVCGAVSLAAIAWMVTASSAEGAGAA